MMISDIRKTLCHVEVALTPFYVLLIKMSSRGVTRGGGGRGKAPAPEPTGVAI